VTIIGLIALLISIFALGIGWSQRTMSRLMLLAALLAVHVAASVYYYEYSQRAVADAWTYYFDPFNLAGWASGLSTILVFKVVHVMKDLGATYLDCFLLFQTIGFAGVMLLVRAFDEIEANVGAPDSGGNLALLFLPSVNFWTAAIGKDAPLFFAVSMCVWAMLNLRRRILYFCLALAVMVLFRAHIALIAAAALAAAAFFDPTVSLGRKLALLTFALAAGWIALGPVKSTINVDVTSVTSVSEFLDKNNTVYATVAGTTSIGHASIFVRAISLLFRPFFFDASGILGLVASAENVLVVFGLIYALIHWRSLLLLSRRILFVRFCLLFTIVLLFSLTLVYYNVGLGLRQRVMAYPTIFSMLVALWSMRRKYTLAERTPEVPRGLMLEINQNRALPEL
jgi:hypothetical protein